MFSLIYVWINDWVNNRDAGDLRWQDSHYDVIGMVWWWTVRVGFPHATIIPWVTLWWVQLVGYILACRSHRLSVQYTISLSSSCKLIWRHWTYKMPVRYILSSVWVRLSLFSQLSFIQYVGLCVFSLPVSLMTNERMYILIIIIKSKVWTIIHCLGLGHETMVCAVCLSIFLWGHDMGQFPMLQTLCGGNDRSSVNTSYKSMVKVSMVVLLLT